MAKTKNNKKPTMKETVQVINQMIREITALKTDVQTMTGVLDMYIDMKGDAEQFDKFINKQLKIEENDDVPANEEGRTLAVEGGP